MHKKSTIYALFLALALILVGVGISYAQKSTDTVRIRFGNPKEGSSGWPATGYLTQGPRGSASHARIQSVGGGPAIDIANSSLTPIYATFEGTAYAYDCTNRGECNETYGRLGNYVKLIPASNPTAIVLFAHLASVSISGTTQVKPGDLIGLMGETGYAFGVHLHYEFRGLPMTPPNIPEAITPESCGSCNPSYVSSE